MHFSILGANIKSKSGSKYRCLLQREIAIRMHCVPVMEKLSDGREQQETVRHLITNAACFHKEFQMLAVLWVKQSNCQGIAFGLLELFRGHQSGCRNSGLWPRRMSVLPCPQRTWGRSASQAASSSDKNRNKNVSTSVAYPWWMRSAKTGTSRNLGNSSSLPHCGKFSG